MKHVQTLLKQISFCLSFWSLGLSYESLDEQWENTNTSWTGTWIRLPLPHTFSFVVLFAPLWREASHQDEQLSLSFSSGCCEERRPAESHACMSVTMVPLVVLTAVLSSIVVTTGTAENAEGNASFVPPDYRRISLPQEHLPYFLNNNKKVANQCRLDPLCPFKVSYVLRGASTHQMFVLLF